MALRNMRRFEMPTKFDSRKLRRVPVRKLLAKALPLHSLALIAAFAAGLVHPASASACPDIDGLADMNCDGKLEVIFFGDSITAGTGDTLKMGGYPGRMKLYFPNMVVRNLGDPGEKTNRGASRAATRFSQYRTGDYAMVMEGVNDYFNDDRTPAGTRSNILSIVRSAKNSGALTTLSTLTDIRRDFQRPWVLAVNGQIKPHTSTDFFSLGKGIIGSDKLHPNGSGYNLMAAHAAGVLRNISSANRPADRDGDGIYDFAEPRFGTSAGNADSDGDGLLDGTEVFTYHSNPLSVDSDGDGFADGFEVEFGTDPTSRRPTAPHLTDLHATESAPH